MDTPLDFLDLPARSSKPRATGLTQILDYGLGTTEVRDYLDLADEFVDIVKFGWGSGYISNTLGAKMDLYASHDVEICFGGTLFEVALIQNRFDEFVDALSTLGVEHVEVSTGTVDIPHERKCEYIRELSESFTVFSEVGDKSAEVADAPEVWVEHARREKEAGAWKVILEGRASGEAGIYHRSGEIREDLIDALDSKLDSDDLLFEAPNKRQQVWLIERFGNEVNLGNVALRDGIPLETLRLGLRGDTAWKFLER